MFNFSWWNIQTLLSSTVLYFIYHTVPLGVTQCADCPTSPLSHKVLYLLCGEINWVRGSFLNRPKLNLPCNLRYNRVDFVVGTNLVPCDARPLLSLPTTDVPSCADCDAELMDYGNIWASVGQGCFVCVHCLAVHRSLGFRTQSVNMDCWAPDEVERMTAMGNVKVLGDYRIDCSSSSSL